MIHQEAMIEKVRELCKQDENLLAAMMYGSFAKRSGDQYSDIEFVFFFKDEIVDTIDQQAWLAQIAPVEICYINEFGVTDVVFDNLIRGEFHFEKISDIGIVSTWKGTTCFPSLEDTRIVDKVNKLTPHLRCLIEEDGPAEVSKEQVEFFVNSFCNWMIFGLNLLKRGDDSHALNILWMVQRYVLSLARVCEHAVENLPGPSKNLANELSSKAFTRYRGCTSDLQGEHLKNAYNASLDWGQELIQQLEERYGRLCPEGFMQKLKSYVLDV